MKSSKLTPSINGQVKHLLVITTVLFSAWHSAFADAFNERDDYGALLEPAGKVINGAGPTPVDFENYWNVMGDNNKPMVYMDYVGLKDITKIWPNRLKAEILKYQSMFVIPQIGLSMTEDGDPDKHYEHEVANGLYDDEINIFLDGLEELAIPVYLRIGYEFNGLGWNGYQPGTYIDAFRYITDKIRERDLEVATVWDAAADGVHNYYDYYPGYQYVDWWAINTFEPNHFLGIGFPTLDFLNDAINENKPVMIGESTARGTGVLEDANSWNKWFVPYFEFIRSHPGIKMFCYINFNWTEHTQWEDWGDCRLEQSAYVSEHFADEMTSSLYLHAKSEHDFRKTLGYSDNTAPPAITKIVSDDSSYPAILQWDAVTDSSGLAHYIVYQDGNIVDYTLKPRFICSNAIAGDIVDYHVTAMDRAGNESPMSEAVRVVVPHSIPKIINGEFDDGFDGWNQNVWGGSADFSIDTSSAISGSNAAHINITSSPGEDWRIQLRQFMKIHKGKKYTIRYKSKASKNVILKILVQMEREPYSIFFQKLVSLTSEIRIFTHSTIIDDNNDVYLAFMMGDLGEAEVWIDAVSVTEEKIRTDLVDFSLLASEWLQCNRIPQDSCLLDAQTPAIAPPVAHWKLDETSGNTAFDTAGSHNGTVYGQPTWLPGGGQIDGALLFNNAGDYVVCGTFNPSEGTGQLSVCLWAKWNGLNGQWQTLTSKRDSWSVDDMMWQIEAHQTNGTLGFFREGSYPWDGDPCLPIGEWAHVAATSDGNTATFYFDGLATGSGDFLFGTDTKAAVVFGAGEADGSNPFNGALDDIRLYNYPLTADEIRQLVYPDWDIMPPVAHWKLDEVDGNDAPDTAGGSHGVLHGEPVWQPTGGIMLGSLQFDGINDYVDCGTDPNLNITGAVSVTAWIKLAAIHVDQKIAGKQDNKAGGYKMGLISDGKVEFEIRDADNKPTLNRGFPGGKVLQPGIWYHVTGLYSEGEYIRTYVNGILDRDMPTSAILAPTDGAMVLGRAPFINHSFFDGCIDDVRVYDRALSENEIVRLLCVKQPAADYNCDCKVDWDDLNIFASMWLH